jgi:hypothetical protein
VLTHPRRSKDCLPEVRSRFRITVIAEPTDAVDRAGILAFRAILSARPARQLILVVRQ